MQNQARNWRTSAVGNWGLKIAGFVLFLLAAAPRLARLDWQPLWWDEGYSVYFATEPLARMLALTARDIHPPLYYALLHGWTALLYALGLPGASPVALRSFSVLCAALTLPAFWWLARSLFPGRWRLHVIAVGLLLLSPLHIFYSQEVRMYGLALLLGTLSSGLFWRLLVGWRGATNTFTHSKRDLSPKSAPRARGAGLRSFVDNEPASAAWGRTLLERGPHPAAAAPSCIATRKLLLYATLYFLTATALLYTLYYGALLLAAHFVYGFWVLRRSRRAALELLAMGGAIALLYTPWLLYAAPRLATYIAQKVTADADTPLPLLSYALRHLRAFTAGHVTTGSAGWEGLLSLGVVGTLGLFVMGGLASGNWVSSTQRRAREQSTTAYCLLLTLFPLAIGFVINLINPFFPKGGERLMLVVLPYFLLWLAAAADGALSSTRTMRRCGTVALALLGAVTVAGSTAFFAVPRYTERDYRPVVQQIVEQGTEGDRVLSIFPWQVGYWRAYTSNFGAPAANGHALDFANANALANQPLLLSDDAVEWSPAVTQALDSALDEGRLWFPAPLSFGSALPAEIERHLKEQAVNVANDWLSETTRLSAWERPHPLTSFVNPPILWQSAVGNIALVSVEAEARTVSANEALSLRLLWDLPDAASAQHFVALRLVDSQGRQRVIRRYEPLDGYATLATTALNAPLPGRTIGNVGLIVPPGLPPGTYSLQIGVGSTGTGELLVGNAQQTDDEFVALGTVQVDAPDEPLPPMRLPLDRRLDEPLPVGGAALLGYSGAGAGAAGIEPVLAGTALDVTLGWLATEGEVDAEIELALLDGEREVAGWRGNPLAGSAAVGLWQTPIDIFLPTTLPSGDYELAARAADDARFTPLGTIRVVQRTANFAETSPAVALKTPVQFGTHAELVGYDLEGAGDALTLRLHWRVLQPIVPPHHIFVHAENASGERVAQADAEPRTVAGPAPTGSWQPDERLITEHLISAPGEITRLRAGLYEPTSGARLPASVDGEIIGDGWEIPLE